MLLDRPRAHWRDVKVLGLFPHPDDEAWAAAGTLAALAEAGAQVRCIFATDGDAGADWTGEGRKGPALAAARRDEATAASRLLGLQSPRFLGLGDGTLAERHDLATQLRDALAEAQADVVLDLGPEGGYPHRDHIALHRALTTALRDGLDAVPMRWHRCYPPGGFAPLLALLRRTGSDALLDPGLPDATLGADWHHPQACTVELDARAAERKRAAIAAHRSQLPRGRPAALLGPGVVEALLRRERWIAATPPLARVGALR